MPTPRSRAWHGSPPTWRWSTCRSPAAVGSRCCGKIGVRHPETLCLVLSFHDAPDIAEWALRAGARGFLVKDEDGGTVLEGLRDICEGHVVLSRRLRDALIKRAQDAARSGPPAGALTDRQWEVFSLLARGWDRDRTAAALSVSPATVRGHLRRIRERLGLASDEAAVRHAVRWHGRSSGEAP